MRRTDVDHDGNNLAGSIGLDIGGVVGVLVALAQPDITLGRVVVGLASGDLKHALDVAVRVGGLVVVNLGTASSLHSSAGGTRGGRGDHTMGRDHGDQAGRGESVGCRLHDD